jgi:hypothetical protein
MADRRGFWPAAESPPPGWLPAPGDARPPSDLPAQPARPVYREPYPIRLGPLFAGMGAGVVWFALFGSIGRDLFSYAWWTVAAAVSAWAVALVLSVLGDRGVAVGVALTAGLGLSIAGGLVAFRWMTTNDWPLW